MPDQPRVPDLTHVPDLEQLRALVETARAGSMSGAAKRLGISQQAVSARVRAAERLVRVAVFQRTTQGAEPTPSGARVVGWAEEILAAASRLEEGVAGLSAEDDRVVRVAASNTISEVLLPGWAAALRAERPDAQVQVTPGNSDMVLAAVAHGDADLGFVEGPGVPRELASLDVGADHLMVVVPPDHRWASLAGGIDRAELARTPLVLREEGSGTRTTFEDAVPERVPPVQVQSSTPAVRDACLTLGAPTVLSALAVRRDVEAGRLVEVEVRDLAMPRRLRAVWRPSERPRGAAERLLRLAASRAPEA